MLRKSIANKYLAKAQEKEKIQKRKENLGPSYSRDVTDGVFVTIDAEQAKEELLP